MNSDQDSSNYDQALTDANSWFELLKEVYAWLDIDFKAAIFKNAKKSKDALYNLYKEVLEHGGWSNAIGSNSWSSIDKKLAITDSRSTYENFHLVVLEKKHNPSTRYSTGDISLLKGIIPSNLKAVPIVTPSPDGAYDWDTWLEYDLLILRNYVYDVWKIDTKLMSMRSLEEDHSDFPVDILTQANSELDFKVKSATKDTVSMIDYLKIMKQASAQKEANNKIKFAVNVDLGSWEEEIDEIRKKLPAKILWDSKYDSLKYTRQHILGMTLPQAYLKIKGCWTGGHEENLRFCAANINHGPSDVEWWTLKTSENLKFRDCVLRDYNFDIYTTETLWWPDLIYCLAKGFTVYHVVQKPGDLVLVGASAIHWVKSCDVTVNTAWNFGPKTLKNFQLAFERYDINLKINYRNLVPMNILALDLLNHEMSTLPTDLVKFLSQKTNEAYKEDKKSLDKLAKANISLNQVDNVLCCENCFVELFWLYYRCNKCYKNRLKNRTDQECVFCKMCAFKVHKPKCKSTIEVIQKFTPDDFKKFQKRIENVLNSQELEHPLQQELLYPYDKFVIEGIYKSSFGGIETDGSILEINQALEETKTPSKKSLKAKKGKNKAMSYASTENKNSEKEDFAFPALKSDKTKKAKIILPPIESMMNVEEHKEESGDEKMEIEEEKTPIKKKNKSKEKEEVSKIKDKSQASKSSKENVAKPAEKKKEKEEKPIEQKKEKSNDDKKDKKIAEDTAKKYSKSKKPEPSQEEPQLKHPKSLSKKDKAEIQEKSEISSESLKNIKMKNSSEIAVENIIESKEKNSSNRRRLRTRKPPKKYSQTSLPLKAYRSLAQKNKKYGEEEDEEDEENGENEEIEENEEEDIEEEKVEEKPTPKLKPDKKEKINEENEEKEKVSEEKLTSKKPVAKLKSKGNLKEKLEKGKEIVAQALPLPENKHKEVAKKETKEQVKEKLPEKRQRKEEKPRTEKKEKKEMKEKKMKINEIIKAENNKKITGKRDKKDNEEHREKSIEGHGYNKENLDKAERSSQSISEKVGLPVKKKKLEENKEPKPNQEIVSIQTPTPNAMDIDEASLSQPLPKSISEIFPKIPQKFDIIPRKPKII